MLGKGTISRMKDRYVPKDFEDSLINMWDNEKVYKNLHVEKANKSYVLAMFPYPSGSGLHVGHARIYTGSDILARFYRMQGKSLIYPMGWDAFGLPAENAAIKEKKNPMDMVPRNIETFKGQMKRLGLSFDFSREFSTSDPKYYKWTQWLFIQFYKKGLLYKKNTTVFFCEFCKTGLAQEEVLSNGTHERCGKHIITKELPQWIFKITSYADRLLKDLEGLGWPGGILEMQKKWIGKKEGMLISHMVVGTDISFQTFTAYPTWSFADTFIVIAPEHPLVKKLIADNREKVRIEEFIAETKKITSEERTEDKFEKKGIFTGKYAKDPFGGKDMPIWIANFALMDFGTGIIRCSAHDPRDYEFAQKYGIELKEVVDRKSDLPVNAHDNKGTLKDSGPFTGKKVEESLEDIKNWIIEKNIGNKHVTYHLRDWIFSRQRYWGEPIPMVYCEKCAKAGKSFFTEKDMHSYYKETVYNDIKIKDNTFYLTDDELKTMAGWYPLSEEVLPLQLPYVKSYEPNTSGKSPLADIVDFTKTSCPCCGSDAERETDTMPNWAGSCWYFLRFADPHNSQRPWNKEVVDAMLPVDWYLGGADHAVLHLLYSRFWVKALYDLGLIDFLEPFQNLRNVGMVLAEDHKKMSKSVGNVINPDDVIAEYGADALRVYVMFMAPFNAENAWSTSSLQGSYRFLQRIWQIYNNSDKLTKTNVPNNIQLVAELQSAIISVTSDITNVKYNTAIAHLMTYLNNWDKNGTLSYQDGKKYLQLLAPFAPFLADHIWREIFGEKESIHISKWPQADLSINVKKETKIAVQVNGKVRSVIIIADGALEKDIVIHALGEVNVKKYVDGRSYTVIYIQGKVMNFIVN